MNHEYFATSYCGPRIQDRSFGLASVGVMRIGHRFATAYESAERSSGCRRMCRLDIGAHSDTLRRVLDLEEKEMIGRILVVLVLAVSLCGCAGCTRVGPGYAGIKVSMAGSNRGVDAYPTTTGWVFYNAFTESVLEYPTFVQTAVWTKNTAEGKPVNEEITFTTKDSMQVSADISLAYQLVFEKVPYFYVQFRSDDLDRFTHGFLRNLAREKFDNAAGKYSIDQIMGDNATFLADARASLQRDLDPLGISLKQMGFIGAPRPPQGVIDSINLKVQASQIALQKQMEVAQAEADSRKRVAKAEGDAKAMLINADAEAEANRKVAASITPTLVEWRKMDKWDGHLSMVSGAGSGVLLNIPQK